MREERQDPKVQAHLREALDLIQRAQDRLDDALELLSPIVGMHADWKRLSSVRERVHRAWWHLERRRQHVSHNIVLDHQHSKDGERYCRQCRSAATATTAPEVRP